MPIKEEDPWRSQYFECVRCPEDILIPTEDADAYMGILGTRAVLIGVASVVVLQVAFTYLPLGALVRFDGADEIRDHPVERPQFDLQVPGIAVSNVAVEGEPGRPGWPSHRWRGERVDGR